MLDSILKASYDEFCQASNSSVKTIATPESMFDVFLKKCIQHHGQPVHTFQEMRTIKSTKAKGDLFELFCQRYLLTIKDYDQVWLLRELTQELKIILKLPLGQKDYGVDLIALRMVEGQPIYSAIQCKFKTPRAPIQVKTNQGKHVVIYPSVGWKEISTFNELCNASGPFKERITMTTAKSVRRMGGIKNEIDQSICLQGLKGLSTEQWMKLMNPIDRTETTQSPTEDLSESSPSQVVTPETSMPTQTGKIKLKMKTDSPPIIPSSIAPAPAPALTSAPPKKNLSQKVKQTKSAKQQMKIEDIRNKRLEYLEKSGILIKKN
jgi:hypothetical protein